MSRFPRWPRFVVVTFAVAASLTGAAQAQRQEAHAEWQKHEVIFSYGAPRVAKHSIDELKVGDSWRIGSGDATTLTLDAPLLTADSVVPPGAYRVNLGRPSAEQFNLQINGPGSHVDEGRDDIVVAGKRHDASKANDKLELRLTPEKEQPDAELRRLSLVVQFGILQVEIPLTIVGTQSTKAKGLTLEAFKIPEKTLNERLAARKHTPVAALGRADKGSKDVPERMNLLLAEKVVILQPTMKAPTESFGFGAIPKLDAAWILHGTVVWSEATEPADHFRVDAVDVDKGSVLHVTATCRGRRAEITVPTMPTKK